MNAEEYLKKNANYLTAYENSKVHKLVDLGIAFETIRLAREEVVQKMSLNGFRRKEEAMKRLFDWIKTPEDERKPAVINWTDGHERNIGREFEEQQKRFEDLFRREQEVNRTAREALRESLLKEVRGWLKGFNFEDEEYHKLEMTKLFYERFLKKEGKEK